MSRHLAMTLLLAAVAACGQSAATRAITLSAPLPPAAAAAAVVDRDGDLFETHSRASVGAVMIPPDEGLRTVEVTNLDPGNAPEGDYLGWTTFTRDGGRVLLSNRMTDNVTIFDWGTKEVLANVPVGRYPAGIAVSDDYAVVACAFADRVDVIDLDTYTVVASLPTGEQPWVVRVSEDGTRAYVACDISNTCEVIDLATMTIAGSIPDFPIALMSFSFNSECGRNTVTFSNFELTPDGSHIVAGNLVDAVWFIDTATGMVDAVVPGITNSYAVALSGNGSRVIAYSAVNPLVLYRIDVATHAVTGSVTLAGYQYGMTYDMAVDATGSKAFVSVSGNASALVRFDAGTFKTFTSTYSPFWIGVSPDHRYAVGGQTYFSLVDFQTELVVGQYVGEPESYGAVARNAFRVVGYDPTRHEGLYFLDCNVPSAPAYRGTANTGLDPEADAPRRIAVAPDGSKAVVTNVLSDNAAIVNLQSRTVEAFLPMGDRVQDVAITPDSRTAVVCAFNTNTAKVVDLTTNTVVADVPTGTRSTVVSIGPDGQYAYVGCVSSNTVSVIHLAGAASARVAEIAVGEIGVVWANYGVSSGVAAAPSGRYVLVAVSFDDRVKVIDTTTNTIVANLVVGDFPLEIAFDGTGDYAIVTNYFSNSYSVIRVNGVSSSVIGTYSRGTKPMRLAYNAVLDETGVGNYESKTVNNVDPRTGALHNTISYATYGAVDQIRFSGTGQPLVLTASNGADIPPYLHAGVDAPIELPAEPSFFDYSVVARRAAVVMPGPDWVTIIDWNPVAAPEVVTIPLRSFAEMDAPVPNPATGDRVALRYRLEREGAVAFHVVDLQGRLVARMEQGIRAAGEHTTVLETSSLGSGDYFITLVSGGVAAADRRKLVVVRDRK